MIIMIIVIVIVVVVMNIVIIRMPVDIDIDMIIMISNCYYYAGLPQVHRLQGWRPHPPEASPFRGSFGRRGTMRGRRVEAQGG